MTSTFSTFTRGTESDTFAFASRPPRQPRPRKKASLSNLVDSISRATSAAYDTFIGSQSDDEDNDGLLPVAGVLRRRRSGMFGRLGDIGSEMMSPRREVVEVLVRYWWSRAIVFIVVPAGLVVGWAAIPLPVTVKEGGDAGEVWSIVEMLLRWLWPKKEGLDALIATASSIGTAGVMGGLDAANGTEPIGGGPGHGTATVQIHFWFFLVVYYGYYLLMGLFYMNSLFNLYNMNWWPARLGGPATYILSWSVSVSLGYPIYHFARPLAHLNITWILLTFITMCLPALISFIVLHAEDRHSSLRYHQPTAYLDEPTSSNRNRGNNSSSNPDDADDEDDPNEATSLLAYGNIFTRGRSNSNTSNDSLPIRPTLRSRFTRHIRRRTRWIPYSYIRFLWFCAAILIGLLAFVLGELYAEIYLRTLPHSNKETVIYVYSWVGTILALDGITGWILSSQVQSYPLEFVFKLYFSLTYYTYIRTLYARLRSPSQFALLQLLSSSLALIIQPIYISHTFHRLLRRLGFTSTSYAEHTKITGRSFFIRGLSENVSMAAFLGTIIILHFGPNKAVYPYLSFPDSAKLEPGYDGYNFNLTFVASLVTWGLEIVSSWAVRRIYGFFWEFGVTGEGKRDLVDFAGEGLLGSVVVVMVHVLQNMLVSIIRLKFD